MDKFHVSDICSAFQYKTIGTKVDRAAGFEEALKEALEHYQMPQSGQGFIALPSAIEFVSCGVAKLSDCVGPEDFVIRRHRDKWSLFAKRHLAAETESLHVVLYTKDAYLADPDVNPREKNLLEGTKKITHIIVAVIAGAGPKPPLPPNTLLHNIAGGNNEFKPKSHLKSSLEFLASLSMLSMHISECKIYADDLALLHHIINQAKETEKYWSDWIVVAD